MTRNNELFQLAQEYQKIVGLKVFRAILGDADGRVDVQGQDGYVYVRYQGANGFSQPMIVPFRVSNMKKTPGMGVLIKYDYDKVWAVVGADYPALLAQGTNPTVNNPADDNNSYYVNQYRITTLVSHPISSAANSMIVTVQPFLAIIDGVVTLFMGDQVDLTASIPASTGKWGIACIFWKPSDNTLEIVISTPKDNQTDLGIDDVQECLDGRSDSTNIPVWAWQVFTGQTGITPGNIQAGGDDFLDLRQFINVVDSASSGSGTVTSVALTAAPSSVFNVSGSPVTTAGTLALSMDDQAANKVLAGPTTGADAAPAFRALVNADIPQPLTLVSPVINTGVSGSAIDNDPTLAANSSTLLATQQATKAYTDQAVLGVLAKTDVRLATAAALATNVYANGAAGVGATLTGFATGVLTVDGVTVAINDRILVKDEVTQANNGIYKCTVAGAIGVAYVLTRTTDGDTDAELRGAWMVSVFGTVNGQQAWVNTNASAITFGSTAITWGEFSAGVITAGTGLTKTGNSIALDTPVALANGGTHADLSATGGTSQFLKQSTAGANVTVGTIADADVPDALTISGGTINNTPIGATTASTLIASAISLLIGGFKAIFTHANTVNRTYTYPDIDFTVGRDTFIIAKNISGSTIAVEKLVYFGGDSTSQNATIPGLAIANSTLDKLAQGLTRQSIANNAFGIVQIGGVYQGATSAASFGLNYLSDSVAGTMAATPPSAPSFTQIVANGSNSASNADLILLFQSAPSIPEIPNIQAFGDGSDGNVTVSAPLTLTRDMYYANLTISAGAAITPAGFRIFVSGILDITAAPAGWLINKGGNASGATAGAAAPAATIGGSGAGGAGLSSGANAVGSVGIAGDEGGSGGNGGRSGGSASTGGATSSTGFVIKRWAVELLRGIALVLGGTGGTGGTTGVAGSVSGGGGGGGGIIYIAANTINRGGSTTAAGVQATGGNGAAGNNVGGGTGPGGGGGGGGGWIYVIYKSLTGSTATNLFQASGGTGGNGGNASTTGGTGGTGGSGGRITLINILTGVLTETTGGAGTAGSANTGATGGAGGAGNTFQASL